MHAFRHVVAITGTKASGKSVLANLLVSSGYVMVRYSERIAAELQERFGETEPTTERLQDYANDRRQELGAGYWTGKVLARAAELGVDRLVLDGVRNPGELEVLRQELGPLGGCWHVVVTDADTARREAWFLERRRANDPATAEGFRRLDARDRGEGEPSHGQQVDACMATLPSADWLRNNGTRDEWEACCRGWVATHAPQTVPQG